MRIRYATLATLLLAGCSTLGSPSAPRSATVSPAVSTPHLAPTVEPTISPTPQASAPATEPGDALALAVTAEEARTHLEALQRIAHDHAETRATGTNGYAASVEYVADTLTASGYEVQRHVFDLPTGGSSVSVVAETAGAAGSEVVMLGAHLDSVDAGPGINDNGSGVAALLVLADELAAGEPLHRIVRFAFWGAEEGGPIGSRAYVDGLADADRERITAYLNFDMLASPNPLRLVYDEAGAAAGSNALTELFAGALESAGLTWELIDLEGDSDHGPFTDAGIPTGGLFSGGIEPVTDEQAARFGADAGVAADPCSHRPCDTIDNVNARVLDELLDAMAVVVVALVAR